MNPYFAAHLELPSSRQAILSTNSPSKFFSKFDLDHQTNLFLLRQLSAHRLFSVPSVANSSVGKSSRYGSDLLVFASLAHGFSWIYAAHLKADSLNSLLKSNLNIFARRICMPRGETLFNLSRSLYDICSVIGSVTKNISYENWLFLDVTYW